MIMSITGSGGREPHIDPLESARIANEITSNLYDLEYDPPSSGIRFPTLKRKEVSRTDTPKRMAKLTQMLIEESENLTAGDRSTVLQELDAKNNKFKELYRKVWGKGNR
jgi:hypothetical protein